MNQLDLSSKICLQMADELFDLLDQPELQRSRIFLDAPPGEYSFLDRIIKPIHGILAAVRLQPQLGSCSHFGLVNVFHMYDI